MRIGVSNLAFAALAVMTIGRAMAGESSAVKPGDDVCLQNNRLWSWNVVNNRTISITDRTSKRFTVRLASGCVGLNNLIGAIEISERARHFEDTMKSTRG